ncbi:MAG: putative lipid II flippase FtsW [Oscillospiraceae bacterium]|jgi:cell division protein FtsW
MPRRKRDLTARQQLARGPVDLPFLMLVLMLTAIGVIAMFSASYASAYYESKDHNATYYFVRQALFAIGGVLVMWLISRIDYQTFRWVSVFILGISIVLLVLVKVPGFGRTVNGANRWVKLPGLPQFQPSEIAKVGVILYFASRMSKRDTVKKKPWNAKTWLGRTLAALEKIGLLELLPYVGILLVVGGLLLWEPHMSGTILIFAGAAAVLFAGGIHWGWFAAGGAVVGGGLWFIMNNTDYMLRRITLWKDPWSEPRGGGFQTIQSLYAIGSGGLLGKGFGKSMQKFLYLPEEQNDFVFAVWCEEMGLIGAIVVLALFALLIIRGYWLAIHARDKFGALLIVGVTTLLAVQVFLNIAVVTNLIPVTGISLPFFSYGGTALMIQLAEMGMVLGVSRQIQAPRQG